MQHAGTGTACLLHVSNRVVSSLQDYELFVEAVEQNTLQEFLKLA